MATLFATFLGALGGGGGAAAGATAAATTGFSATSFFSGLATVVGGLASVGAGAAAKSAQDQQAVQEETGAVQETLDGRQQALNSLRKLNDDMAKITVAGYASGLQSSGSVQTAQNEAREVGEQNINMARNNAAFQSASRRTQAKQHRIEGKAAYTGGLMGAVEGGLSMFSRRTARG